MEKEMKKMTKHTQNKIRVAIFKILPNTNDTQKNMYNIYICSNLQNSKMEEITKIHYENSKLKQSIMKTFSKPYTKTLKVSNFSTV